VPTSELRAGANTRFPKLFRAWRRSNTGEFCDALVFYKDAAAIF
jgi:hypothetical protein